MPTRALDFSRAMTFMFEEADWLKKFLIGAGVLLLLVVFMLAFILIVALTAGLSPWLAPLGLLLLFPALIPVMVLTGYSMEISRRTANGSNLLPEWSTWYPYLKDGGKLTLAALLYAAPAAIPIVCLAGAIIVSADAQTGELDGMLTAAIFCVNCVVMLYVIPMYVLLYAGLVEYLRTGEFSDFFKIRNMAALQSGADGNPRKNFALVLLMIVFPLGIVASAIPVLGYVWAMYAQGHLLGQILQQTGSEMPASPTERMVNSI